MSDACWKRLNDVHKQAVELMDEPSQRSDVRALVRALSCVAREALGGTHGSAPWPSVYARDKAYDAMWLRNKKADETLTTDDERALAQMYDELTTDFKRSDSARVRDASRATALCAHALYGTDTDALWSSLETIVKKDL